MDIIEIDRVARLCRTSPRFLKRVFTEGEIRYCSSRKNKWQHFAVRFAAKEAVWKALDRPGVALKDIEVLRTASGRPEVAIRGRREPRLRLSLSHGDRHALAVALSL